VIDKFDIEFIRLAPGTKHVKNEERCVEDPSVANNATDSSLEHRVGGDFAVNSEAIW
jgi:hypothetical protein